SPHSEAESSIGEPATHHAVPRSASWSEVVGWCDCMGCDARRGVWSVCRGAAHAVGGRWCLISPSPFPSFLFSSSYHRIDQELRHVVLSSALAWLRSGLLPLRCLPEKRAEACNEARSVHQSQHRRDRLSAFEECFAAHCVF